MQKFKLDTKTIIYLSFYIVLILDLVLILPYQIKKNTKLHSKTRDFEKNILQFNKDVASQGTLIEEKEKISKDILNMEGKIITRSDISMVSAYISSKAKENAVEILEIQPASPKAHTTILDSKFSYLPINIEAKAGFHNLAQFINTLERGYYFLETKELVIKKDIPYNSVSIVVYALLRE